MMDALCSSEATERGIPVAKESHAEMPIVSAVQTRWRGGRL